LKNYITCGVLLAVWWITSCSHSFLEIWQVLLSILIIQKVADEAQITRIGRSQNSGEVGSVWSQGNTSKTEENLYATHSIVYRSKQRKFTALKSSKGQWGSKIFMLRLYLFWYRKYFNNLLGWGLQIQKEIQTFEHV